MSAFVALLLAAAWLWLGVPLIAALMARWAVSGAAGEALFTLLAFTPLLVVAMLVGQLAPVPIFTGEAAKKVGPMRASLRGGALGFAALALATGYLALAGTLRVGVPVSPAWVASGLLVIGFQVLAEEALFRGVVQPALVRQLGALIGIAITAALFAALHLLAAGAGAATLLNLFLGGLLFGSLAWHGQGITAAWGAHWAWNTGEQLVFGLDPNPGVGAFGAVWNLDAVGPARWGGSGEGLNASWAMSFALLAVTLPRIVTVLGGRRTIAVDRVAPCTEAR